MVAAPRRRNRRRRSYNRRRRSYSRRRNPSVFGHSGVKSIGTIIVGGLVGVTLTKFIPTVLPGVSMLGTSSLATFGISVLSAILAGWGARRFINEDFGNGVLFGGLMQSVSVGLNAFLPSIGSRIALQGGVGYLADTGTFPVPNNQFRSLPAPTPVQARVTMSGLDRAFGRAI